LPNGRTHVHRLLTGERIERIRASSVLVRALMRKEATTVEELKRSLDALKEVVLYNK